MLNEGCSMEQAWKILRGVVLGVKYLLGFACCCGRCMAGLGLGYHYYSLTKTVEFVAGPLGLSFKARTCVEQEGVPCLGSFSECGDGAAKKSIYCCGCLYWGFFQRVGASCEGYI